MKRKWYSVRKSFMDVVICAWNGALLVIHAAAAHYDPTFFRVIVCSVFGFLFGQKLQEILSDKWTEYWRKEAIQGWRMLGEALKVLDRAQAELEKRDEGEEWKRGVQNND